MFMYFTQQETTRKENMESRKKGNKGWWQVRPLNSCRAMMATNSDENLRESRKGIKEKARDGDTVLQKQLCD